MRIAGESEYSDQRKDAVERLSFGVRFLFASQSTTLNAVT